MYPQDLIEAIRTAYMGGLFVLATSATFCVMIPLLTASPSLARSVQNDNDESIVNAPSVRNA